MDQKVITKALRIWDWLCGKRLCKECGEYEKPFMSLHPPYNGWPKDGTKTIKYVCSPCMRKRMLEERNEV